MHGIVWLVLASLLAACSAGTGAPVGDGAAGAGGTGGGGAFGPGGMGGSGPGGSGGGEDAARRAACERLCDGYLACGFVESEDACTQTCIADERWPAEVIDTCAACLEPVACEEVLFSCEAECSLPRHDLVLEGADLDRWEGRAIWVVVSEDRRGPIDGGGWTLGERSAVDFRLELRGMLLQGERYVVDVFVDASADGLCNPDAGDPAWRFVVDAVASDVTLTVRPSEHRNPIACGAFDGIPADLQVRGSGFDEAEGRSAVVSVVEHYRGAAYSVGIEPLPIAGGRFEAAFPRALWQGSTFDVAWFVDEDGDGRCSPAESGGLASLGEFAGHVTVELEPDDATFARCQLFPGWNHDLTYVADLPAAWEGESLLAVLVDGTATWLLEYGWFDVEGGRVEVRFEGLLAEGERYRLVLFRDADRSWSCEAPPDGIWAVELGPVAGDVNHAAPAPAPSDPSLCALLGGG